MRIEGPGGTPQLPPEQQDTYKTQAGDTLRSISSQFNVDPESVKSHNNLTFGLDESLAAGLDVQIPSKQPQVQPSQGGGLSDLVEKVPDASNPFVDPGTVGANWGDSSPGPDPYDNPTWWEVEPPWMQQVSDDSRINPDPTISGSPVTLDPSKITDPKKAGG